MTVSLLLYSNQVTDCLWHRLRRDEPFVSRCTRQLHGIEKTALTEPDDMTFGPRDTGGNKLGSDFRERQGMARCGGLWRAMARCV